MKTLVLNIALAVLLGVMAVAAVLVRPEPERTNFEFIPQMAHSPRANAYAASSVFPDGATLHNPESHTIARGFMPLHYEATPQDALRAGEELRNPFRATDLRAAQRGAKVFRSYCTPCHGADGTGNGLVAQRGYPPPPSLLADHAKAMKDGQIFHVLTYGQNNMPNYASQLTREDRWNVIVHVRALQQAAKSSVAGVVGGAM